MYNMHYYVWEYQEVHRKGGPHILGVDNLPGETAQYGGVSGPNLPTFKTGVCHKALLPGVFMGNKTRDLRTRKKAPIIS
jgi:hypothetical protein